MTTNRDTARSAVEAILGKSGQAVVNYVDEAVSSAQSEFDARFTELVERLSATDGLAAEQTRLSRAITALASRTDSKASAEQVADIQNDIRSLRTIVAGAGRMLAGAMEEVNAASQSTSPASAKSALSKAERLADEAESAQNNGADRLAELENRLAKIETWRQEVVDPTLEELKEWRKNTVDPFIRRHRTPRSESATSVTQNVQPSEEAQTFRRRINPRNWGVIAWILALLFGWIAFTFALNLFGAVQGWLPQVPYLIKVILALMPALGLVGIGLFGGGLLGSWITERLSKNDGPIETDETTTQVSQTRTVNATS